MIQFVRRKLAELCLFLLKLAGPPGISLIHQFIQKLLIVLTTGKVSTTTQQESLFNRSFQVAVRRFHITIFMRLPGIGPLWFHAVVIQ